MFWKWDKSARSGSRNSYDALLASEEQSVVEKPHETIKTQSRAWLRPVLLHLLMVVLYTGAFLTAWAQLPVQKNCHDDFIFSPVRQALSWKLRPLNFSDKAESQYSGYPTPEIDAAWGKLLKNSNIRISEETIIKMNKTSIKLQDGSGMYGAGIQVHHHLHCLKSVRQMVYREYYGIPDEPAQWNHVDHCLNDIRQALMCNADISLLTWDWLPDYRRPWANFHINEECVDWEKLDSWAGEHAFSLFDQKSAVHPELGVSFPLDANGQPDTDPRNRPSAESLDALEKGTNPKGNWGPISSENEWT